MQKSIAIGLLLIFSSIAVFSQKQNAGIIKGIIVEKSTRKPLEFANISLKNVKDSSFFRGTVTDQDGKFQIENLPYGEYKLCYSFIGFNNTVCASIISLNEKQSIKDLGKLSISESTNTLNQVEVVGQKSTFVNSIDRKTFNIGQDLLSKSSSISDLMQSIPSMQVDVDGNVSLRGSDNVTILIDGKPSSMMKLNSAAALQQIPAGNVEKIEIITNPSAKYKPDGTAGIINIVLKKNKGLGLNGNITANVGNDSRYNINGLVNYNTGKINIFGSYGFKKDYRNRKNEITTRTYDNFGLKNYSENNAKSNTDVYYNLVNLGIDYKINENNKVGISGNGNFRFQRQENYSNYLLEDSLQTVTSNYDRNRYLPESESDLDFSGYYQHTFDKEGQELNINFSSSLTTEKEDNYYTNIYQVPAGVVSYDNMFYHHTNDENQLSIEYTKPFSKDKKLECGYQLDNFNNNLNLLRDTLNMATDNWEEDPLRTNRFIRTEYTHVIYATFEQEFKKFSYLIGLRGEQTYTKANLQSKDSVILSQYTRIYPTLHLSYKLTDKHTLQLNYSHRIRRPEDEELNPFPEYQDMQNIRVGNPTLKPEDIHSVELDYQFKKAETNFLSTLYYRYNYNSITKIVTNTGNNVFVTSLENISKNESSGLELVFTTSIRKWANISISENTFYNTIDASELGFSNSKSNISLSANGSVSFNLTKSTTWQISGNYSGEKLTPQGKSLPIFVLNSGIKQELLKRKLTITLSASNIFNSTNNILLIDTPELYRKESRKRLDQALYIGLSYSFGNSSKKQKENGIKYDNQF
ncbi:MAG: TonB-dependent receptor [Paludibacteraceae bacterium]|nr:TonB-dependent receptor [Paludibacteraceae bacterium]